MAMFQSFPGVINSIDPFVDEKIADFDSYEIPAGYGFTANEHFHAEPKSLQMLTIQLGDSELVYCVADSETLKIEEGSPVRVVFAGRQVAAVLGETNGYYAYYKKPLHRKFCMPKFYAGMKAALVSLFGGYILHLLALHQQSKNMGMIFEGVFLFFLIGGVVYGLYHLNSDKEPIRNITLYLKRLMG